ncbi:MAG: hypothetical protein WDN66_02560 [Candidatus Saccharibacteria bacterium]
MSMESLDVFTDPEPDDSLTTTTESNPSMRPYIYGTAVEGVAYGDSSCPDDPPEEV